MLLPKRTIELLIGARLITAALQMPRVKEKKNSALCLCLHMGQLYLFTNA